MIGIFLWLIFLLILSFDYQPLIFYSVVGFIVIAFLFIYIAGNIGLYKRGWHDNVGVKPPFWCKWIKKTDDYD